MLSIQCQTKCRARESKTSVGERISINPKKEFYCAQKCSQIMHITVPWGYKDTIIDTLCYKHKEMKIVYNPVLFFS